MFAALLFILVPLTLFLLAFVIETIMSFKRLTNNKADGSYLSATWETTHTFFVVAVAMFVSIFSDNLTELAKAGFIGLIIIVIFAGLRGAAYLQLFYIRSAAKRNIRNWVDISFSLTHVGMIVGVVVLLVGLLPEMARISPQPNTSFIPWLIPGLLLVLALCVPPILSLYSTKKS